MTALFEAPTVTPLVEVVVDCELDIATLPRVRERLEDALTLRPEMLVVDLTDCPFLDAQAITLLLDVHRAAWRSGSRLVLRGCSSQCLRLLALAGVLDVFDIDDDLVERARLAARRLPA